MAGAKDELLFKHEKKYVFYCSNCRSIFGDSLAMVQMNKNMKSVSLIDGSDSIAITKKCETSTSGDDLGSTYFILECKLCKRPVGRMYRTTPKALDKIRDLYTLDWSKIKSYELGSFSNANIKPDENDTELKTYSMVVALTERVKKLESLVEVIEVDENEQFESHCPYDPHDVVEKKRKLH